MQFKVDQVEFSGNEKEATTSVTLTSTVPIKNFCPIQLKKGQDIELYTEEDVEEDSFETYLGKCGFKCDDYEGYACASCEDECMDAREPKYNYGGLYYTPDGKVYISKVIFSKPATIVMWSDGTKTVSKCDDSDKYSPEAGLSMCVLKKLIGKNETSILFNNWVPETPVIKGKVQEVTLSQVRKECKKNAKSKM